ncbi:MAG: hypothetical protein HWN69_01185 [Desulfobacterales bacterium]|nr:hypothetical protein [Desulfobacterales bacterium]
MSNFPTKEDQGDEIGFEKEIKIDEEPSDFSYQDEMRDLRLEPQIQRLSHRITLLSIVAPCLLCAILLFVYFDLSDKLSKTRNIGSKEVQILSEDVVDKIASLSQQYEKLEKSLIDGVSGLEKSSALIKQDLKRNNRAIKKLAASKTDKKTLDNAVKKHSAKVAKILTGLRNELREQRQVVEDLDKTLKKEVTGIVQIIERLKKDRQKQDLAVKDLLEHKLDKEEFGNILKNKWSGYQARISILQKEIKTLKEGISLLQKQVDMVVRRKTELDHSQKKPAVKATRDTLTPTPDKIIEQEIDE